MFKVQQQNTINFLNDKNDEIKKVDTKKENTIDVNKIAEEQKSKKLNSHDNGHKTEKCILSGASGNINDFGGSSLKTKNNRSIWGEHNHEEIKKEEISEKDFKINLDSLMKCQQTKPVVDNKNENNDVYISNNKTSIATTESKHHNYKKLVGNMSIFSKNDFENLPEKTSGEQLSEKIKNKNAQKDESWKKNDSTVNTKNMLNKLFQ